jgi:hypothetical protein
MIDVRTQVKCPGSDERESRGARCVGLHHSCQYSSTLNGNLIVYCSPFSMILVWGFADYSFRMKPVCMWMVATFIWLEPATAAYSHSSGLNEKTINTVCDLKQEVHIRGAIGTPISHLRRLAMQTSLPSIREVYYWIAFRNLSSRVNRRVNRPRCFCWKHSGALLLHVVDYFPSLERLRSRSHYRQ